MSVTVRFHELFDIKGVRDNDLTFNDSIRILSDIIKISIPLLLVQMERRESTDQ